MSPPPQADSGPPPPPSSPARAAPPDALIPGTVLADRYEIIRLVGQGGMGTVYQARHVAMDRPCALKILHPRLSRDREALERFQREARNASRITHPNVATIFDYGVDAEGRVFLVMEFVAGRSLGAILAEQGTLTLHRATRLLAGAAAGLDAAHALGLVHRDLKPDNMMVAGEGATEYVKLVDFGIAKALEASADQDVTADGVVIGTPEYMAPEQFARDPVDTSVDVYALGLIGYRMLSGRIPHRAATARETLTLRLTEPAQPITTIEAARDLPEILDQVFDRALARRPDQRWPSAGAFAEAMLAVAATVPEPEGAEATLRLDAATRVVDLGLGPTRRMVRRRRITGGVVLAAVLTAGIAFWPRSPESAGGTESADPPVLLPRDSAQAPIGAGADTVAATTVPPATQVRVPPPPPAPSPGPANPPPAQTVSLVLPSVEELLDPDTREVSRQRAQAIYSSDAAGPALKAQAAFMVAQSHFQEQRWADAESWVILAIARNAEGPAEQAQAAREGRYRSLLTQIRRQREEPPPP